MKRKIIVGLMVTMFLLTMLLSAFPVQVSAEPGDPVVIGLVGPKGWIQWDGIKEGAHLAADLINNAPANDKGFWDGIEYHLVEFAEIDEHSVPVPDPTAAVQELLTALETHTTMQFLVGGFRSECVFPLREAAMDYAAVHGRPIWIIDGAASDEVIDDGPEKDNPYDDVREDYERYKYLFRVTPMNSTTVGSQLFYMAAQLIIPKLSALFAGGGPLPAYIIAEDMMWCESIVEALQEKAADLGLDIVGVGRPSSIETDFGPFLDAVEDSGAKLIFHFFAVVAGASFIKQWGEKKVPAVPIGINVESQLQEFYSSIGGKCEYETIGSAVGTRTNLNPGAKPLSSAEFWDVYSARYGHAPVYTTWGSYFGLIQLNETATDWIGKACDEIIPILEQFESNSLLGYFKYTKYHELYCDAFCMTPIWPSRGAPPHVPGKVGTVRAHIPQWQDGRLEVVWPRGYWCAPNPTNPPLPDPTPLPFAMKWKIPPWVYSLGETDFAGGLDVPSPPMAVDGTPAGFFGSFTSPDGAVGPLDMAIITGLWQETCWWTVLEADMDANHFIDIDDVARVALDWGKTA